jgi:UDP-2,4-diacetamido-2,4,6-trideoxy-beta-L-altropyranose hydrolase
LLCGRHSAAVCPAPGRVSVSVKGPTAVFRVDASVEIGSGHVRRCLVLAKALLQDGWSVHFASSMETPDAVPSLRGSGVPMMTIEKTADVAAGLSTAMPGGCDLLVVDHYGLDERFERSCRPWARRILVIDDMADRPHDCEILVDQTPGRGAADYVPLVPGDCNILAGPDYALLDPRFHIARTKARRRDGAVRRIFVSLGATDPKGATLLVLAALQRAKLAVPVDVVVGAANPHRAAVQAAADELSPSAVVHVEVDDMAALIERADLAIGAGGVNAIERCCLGVPSILVVLAENQWGNAEALAKAGAALIVEAAELNDADAFAGVIRALVVDSARRAAMRDAAARVTDGLGASRVRAVCDSLPVAARDAVEESRSR